jgi:hypothetical protein
VKQLSVISCHSIVRVDVFCAALNSFGKYVVDFGVDLGTLYAGLRDNP